MSSLRLENGYILLMTMLIIGAASVAITLALLLNSTDVTKSGLISQQSMLARDAAESCSEEGLLQIQGNTAYTGSGNIALTSASCTYTVTNTGGNNRTIDSSGVSGNSTRKIKIYATIGASSISITSWQEVSDL